MAKEFKMFSHLRQPKDVTAYTLYRGTTDFSNLKQFNQFETGYPYLVLVSVPDFITKLAEKNAGGPIENIIKNFLHILEYEFKGISGGLENIGTQTGEINNGIQSMNVITRTEQNTAVTISMEYTEKAGSVISRFLELYLRTVKDPATQFKTYGGLIDYDGAAQGGFDPDEAGFEHETFSFLYMHTDNTGLLLERAVYYVGCMPTDAPMDHYNATKGDINFPTVTCNFTAFPIQGEEVDKAASEILEHINSESNANCVRRNSWNYEYMAVNDDFHGLAQSKLRD